MVLKAKIAYVKEPRTVAGRLGTYETQGVRLEWQDGDVRQNLFGSFFGPHLETFRALGLQAGSEVEVELLFTVSERNGFFSNYVELQNPRRI